MAAGGVRRRASSWRWSLIVSGLLYAGMAAAGSDERFQHYLSLSLEELMDQKVTISTQSAQSLRDAPSVVSVITADDIKATGATNLVEVLQSVPGIYVKYSQFGYRPLISFRGANDKQTLLMVNGSPMSDLMWRLGIFWKGLPTSMIERVEVIRGPGSALFGTDASAGVINVITKTAAKINENEVGLRAGSYDSQTTWMQYGNEWNGFDFAATLDLSRTDGHDPRIASDAQSVKDAQFGTNVSQAPGDADFGYRNTDLRMSLGKDNWRMLVDYTRHDDLETGLTGFGALDPVTEGRDRRFEAAIRYDNERFTEDWGLLAELRYRDLSYSSGDGFQEWPPGHVDETGFYPDGVINHMRSAEQRWSGEASAVYRGIEHHAVRIGGGYTWQDVYLVEQQINAGVDGDGNPLPAGSPLVDLTDTAHAFAPEKSRTSKYLYLQDVWDIGEALELTIGARYDRYSDFGDAWTPRLALVWQTTETLTTKLLYGQAFRAPYYQELYAETSFSLPNPDLDPERSETWELSFTFVPNRDLRLGMNLFRFQQTDYIATQPALPGQTKGQYQNAGELTIRGIELEAWWQPMPDLRLSGNYSYNQPDDSVYREIGQPQRQAYLRLDWQFMPDWNWNTQANWIGERERRASDARPSVDDYTAVDTTLRYMGVKDWEFALSVRNLFDADAREYTRESIEDDLPLPGRSVFLEARYSFDGKSK